MLLSASHGSSIVHWENVTTSLPCFAHRYDHVSEHAQPDSVLYGSYTVVVVVTEVVEVVEVVVTPGWHQSHESLPGALPQPFSVKHHVGPGGGSGGGGVSNPPPAEHPLVRNRERAKTAVVQAHDGPLEFGA